MSYQFMGWTISSMEDAQQEALEVLKGGGSYVPGIERELLTEEKLDEHDAGEDGRA